ncbi:MAG TPA: glycosyltransferase family 4 protein [Candidatus Thermoplasmatota archaeon]
MDPAAPSPHLRVCMFVHNNYVKDSRVRKEVRTLVGVGHEITVFALQERGVIQPTDLDGAEVIYLPRDPWHLRWVKYLRQGGQPALPPSPLQEDGTPARHDPIKATLVAGQRAPVATVRSLWKTDRGFLLTGAFVLVIAAFVFGRAARLAKLIRRRAMRLAGSLIGRAFSFIMGPFHRPIVWRDFHRRCQRALATRSADVYHAHDLPVLPIAAWAARRDQAPLVYDSHELFVEAHGISPVERWFLKAIERRLIKETTTVITVSESIAEELVERYSIKRPIILLNCPPAWEGAETDWRLRERLKLDRDVPVALYLGGFSPNRGLPELVRAFTDIPRTHLVMMGWGKLEGQLKALALDLAIANRVHFLPPAPYAELLPWTSSADLGLIPYRATNLNNYYSCPNKLFEYMGAGLAVAASDFPELRRYITRYDLGSLFDPDDPKDIARAVNELVADRATLKRRRANARAAARELNWDVESNKLIKMYSTLGTTIARHERSEPTAVVASPA